MPPPHLLSFRSFTLLWVTRFILRFVRAQQFFTCMKTTRAIYGARKYTRTSLSCRTGRKMLVILCCATAPSTVNNTYNKKIFKNTLHPKECVIFVHTHQISLFTHLKCNKAIIMSSNRFHWQYNGNHISEWREILYDFMDYDFWIWRSIDACKQMALLMTCIMTIFRDN